MPLKVMPTLALALGVAGVVAGGDPALTFQELAHSARFWEAHDRGDLAQLALKKLVAARADSPGALLQLGELDLRINQFADAAQVESELATRFAGSEETEEFSREYRFATRDRLQLASVKRLVEMGRTQDARAALDQLFPNGAPREALGIDYYTLMSSAPGSFDHAYRGMQALAARHPGDPRYQLALARLMVARPESALAALELLEPLVHRDDVRAEDVDRLIFSALLRLGVDRAPPAAVDAYLKRNPGDAELISLRNEQGRAREERELLSTAALSRVIPQVQQRLSTDLSSASGSDVGRTEASLWLGRSRRSFGNHAERRAAAELRAALNFSRHDYESEIEIARMLENLGASEEAGELLASASRLAPQSSWLFETRVRWLISHGDSTTAIELLRGRTVARNWSSPSRDKLLFSALERRASVASDAGQLDAAMADMQAALLLAPGDVWMRYRLAEDYRAKGEAQRGRDLMKEGVDVAPAVPEMRYADALYLAHLDDYEGAYSAIDGINAKARSSEMNALRDRMRVAMARAKARRLSVLGDNEGARAALIDAEPAATHDMDRAAELAYSWIGLGSAEHGIGLVEPFVGGLDEANTGMLLMWASVLNSADDTSRLGPVLAKLRSAPGLTETQRMDVKRFQRSLDLREIRDLERRGELARATALLEQMLVNEPDDRQLRVRRAELDLETKHPHAARDRYASLVAEDPDDLDARLSYVRALTESGDIVTARAQLRAVEERLSTSDEELRITLARRQLAVDEPAKALETLRPLLGQTTRADVLMLAGRAELDQRHFALARGYFDQAQRVATGDDARDARLESQAVADRLQSSVSAGVIARHQPGSAGMSQLDAVTIPSSWLIAMTYESRLIVRADAVFLEGGHWWRPGQPAPLIGTLPTAPTGVSPRYTRTRQVGLSPAVGFRTDSLTVDIGSTPLGFLLPKVVGGIEWEPTWHGLDVTLGLARRVVASSELSYAGLEDPITGAKWGGVVQTGPYAGFGLYRADYSVAATLQVADITGTRVPDNRFAGARFSGSWKFLSREDLHADVGATVNAWNYQHNLSNYTFGSGGYYSPHSYVSVSTPVELVGRHSGWVYDVRAAVSYSVSQVSDAAFYPNDAALQAQAMRSTLPEGYGAAFFPGYHSTGFGFSAYGAAERPMSRGWVLGFLIDLDRTDYYHPTTIGVYFRHAFAPSETHTVSPPRPIRPATQ